MTKKILVVEVVEDEAVLAKALEIQFKDEKFKVLMARDGEEGLEIALREHPDLILLDLLMPKMDGITMLKRLRVDAWGKQVPVIVLTVLKNDKKVAEALSLGSYDYLVKSDQNLESVLKKVKEKLGKK